MKIKKLQSNGQVWYCNCVDSPDDGGYYVEMRRHDIPLEIQTGIHPSETEAWEEARTIVFMESAI